MITEAFILPRDKTSISLSIPGVDSFPTITYEAAMQHIKECAGEPFAYIADFKKGKHRWATTSMYRLAIGLLAKDRETLAIVICMNSPLTDGILVTAYYPEETDRV